MSPEREQEKQQELLKRAVDDREAHPWRYYRLDHDTMKRIADQLAERAEQAEADLASARQQIAALQARIAKALTSHHAANIHAALWAAPPDQDGSGSR